MSKAYGADGLILEAGGEITIDRSGLWTGSCRFRFRKENVRSVPVPGNAHPFADLYFMLAERSRILMTPGLWTVVVEYAGLEDEVESQDPQYELSPGVGMEQIETHDYFTTWLAGKPSAPKNGAIFRNPKTGNITASDVPGEYRFDEFAPLLADGSENELGAVKSYYAANNTVWTKSWTRRHKPDDVGRALVIVDEPPGEAPKYEGCNWLQHPVAYVKRGGAYSCVQRWLLSARGGWKDKIYKDQTN